MPSQISSPQHAAFFTYPTLTGYPNISLQGVRLSPPAMCSQPPIYHPGPIPFVPLRVPKDPFTISSVYYPSPPTVYLPSAAVSYSSLRSNLTHTPAAATVPGIHPLPLNSDLESNPIETRTYSNNKILPSKEPKLELERIKVTVPRQSTTDDRIIGTNCVHSSTVGECRSLSRTSVIADHRKGVSSIHPDCNDISDH